MRGNLQKLGVIIDDVGTMIQILSQLPKEYEKIDRNKEVFTIFISPLPILYIIGTKLGYMNGFESGV